MHVFSRPAICLASTGGGGLTPPKLNKPPSRRSSTPKSPPSLQLPSQPKTTAPAQKKPPQKASSPSANTKKCPSDPPETTQPPRQVSFTTPFPPSPTVAIIGGGLSGLICALHLANLGIRSTVFDTGEHGVGGRLATRASIDGSLRKPAPDVTGDARLVFDHAAQFFTVSDPRFVALVEEWSAAGAVGTWNGPVVGKLSIENGVFTPLEEERGKKKYFGVGGMRQLAEHIAAAAVATQLVELRRPMWISSARAMQRKGGWKVGGGEYDAVVIAHNGKCANRLAAPMGVPAVTAALRRLKLSAIWVLMVAFKGKVPVPAVAVVEGDGKGRQQQQQQMMMMMEGAFIQNSEILSWVGNNTAKLRSGGVVDVESEDDVVEAWTLMSTAKYGKMNKVPQEAIPSDVADKITNDMLSEFQRALCAAAAAAAVAAGNGNTEAQKDKRVLLPEQVYTKAQLWGAALPLNSLRSGMECIWDSRGRVGVVGDWVGGGGGSMESAAVSGIALAECIAAESRGLGRGDVGLMSDDGGAMFEKVQGGEDIGVFPA